MKTESLHALAWLFATSSIAAAAPLHLHSSAGIDVSVDPDTGEYSVAEQSPAWTFRGKAAASLRDAGQREGADRVGPYHEISFAVPEGAAPWEGSVRCYDQAPVVLFGFKLRNAAEKSPVEFPRFTAVPTALHPFSYREHVFAPPSFGAEPTSTPWLLFDDRDHAVIVSPAENFMVAQMRGDPAREIVSGLNPALRNLPAGFTHRTVVVFGQSINATWDTWGQALTRWAAKTVPANDSDIGLRYFGYWTDNGAMYYYRYDPSLGYAGTLEKLVARYRAEAIPIRYLQLDSWWYYKTFTAPDGKKGGPKNPALPAQEWNRYGGLIKYEAHPGLFANGLAGFQKEVQLPFITHNRWIDPESPYRQHYRISGVAAIDPAWWRDIVDYIANAGVVCYEQDWLNEIYRHSPDFAATVNTGAMFTDEMAHAAKARGLSVQYCMALPCYFLQASYYDNVTTIRTSGDRFERGKWDNFLFTSRLATAMGIWPWTDVFMSDETDNLLIATLSAGMVGIGDEIGKEQKQNIDRVALPNGVIVKPDVSLLPTDATYVTYAEKKSNPMIASARTDHGALRTAYVFAYQRKQGATAGSFSPQSLGFDGEVVVYDVRAGTFKRQRAADAYDFELKNTPNASTYCIVAPVTASGIAFFGDEGKFVSNGRQRIDSLENVDGGVRVGVTFAATEKSVTLHGLAPKAPRASATDGECGPVKFDAATGHFELTVSAGAGTSTPPSGADATRHATVTLTE